jgi:FkbM family methyltransferase
MGTYTTKHGIITLHGDTRMEESLRKDGAYMYADIEACLPYISGTIVDVGAHVGLWTIPMSRKATKVIAIEPALPTFQLLQKNIHANNVENVILLNVLLGNPAKKYSPGSTISSGSNHYLENGTLAGKTLDTLVTEKISFIKIDVEGMEPEVLSGAQRIISESRPYFIIEVNPRVLKKMGKRPSDVSKYLPGYNFYRFDDHRGWCKMPYLMNSFYNFLAVPKELAQPKSISFPCYILSRIFEKIKGR